MSDEVTKKTSRIPPLPRGDTNQNPTGIGLIELLAEDYATHDRSLMEPGFWAVAVHRFGNWRMDLRRPLRAPCTVAYRAFQTCVHWGWGIKLDYTVKVGRRVRIWHHGGMVLGARSIGDDVHIRQNTTFGVAHRSQPSAKPIIGDRVDIGCGAVIVGHVEVGHDSVIGANAVVTRDVPSHSMAAGVPARVVKTLRRAGSERPVPLVSDVAPRRQAGDSIAPAATDAGATPALRGGVSLAPVPAVAGANRRPWRARA